MFKKFFSNLFSDPLSFVVALVGAILSVFTFGAALALSAMTIALLAGTMAVATVLAYGLDLPWLKVGLAAITFMMNVTSLVKLGVVGFISSSSIFEGCDFIIQIAQDYAFLTTAFLLSTWTVSLWATYVSAYSDTTSYATAFSDGATVLGAAVGTIAGGVIAGGGEVISGAVTGVGSALTSLVSSPWGLLLAALAIYFLFFKDDKSTLTLKGVSNGQNRQISTA